MDLKNTLWVERFRPTTLDEYIGNELLVEKFKGYIESNDIPHLLLYGVPGTGKTTVARILANSVDSDVLNINASDENSVDVIREKIKGFASSTGFQTWKVILLDEADYLTINAQAILRNLMETFSKNTRFILTCNHIEKIHPAIRSRCQEYSIHPPDKKSVALRLISIMKADGVEFDIQDVGYVINAAYPDIRKIINITQNSIISGKLKIDKHEKVQLSYMDEVLEVMVESSDVQSKYRKIRQIIADSKVRDFTGFYRFLYDNVSKFSRGKDSNMILIIADYQYTDSLVVDKEINVMAMIIKLLNEV